MSYWTMKRRVELYKSLIHKKSKQVPDELIKIETEINKLKAKIEDMKAKDEPQELIAEVVLDLGVLQTRYRTLIKQYDSE